MMESKKEPKQMPTEKTSRNRRNLLRLGALGAVAVLAANVITSPDVRAASEQAVTRQAGKPRMQKTLHSPIPGKAARKEATMRTLAPLSDSPSSLTTRSTKRQAMRGALKTPKGAAGERASATRQTAQIATKKAKAPAQ